MANNLDITRDYKIEKFNFNDKTSDILKKYEMGKDWPVVYIINNDKELYVGETTSARVRVKQHRSNPERRHLTSIRIIFDKQYNKSSILDIEQSLIQLFKVDQKFILQNKNRGQSKKHNYYQRLMYQNKLDNIWADLQKEGLANQSIAEIRNSNLFKFSPYSQLTDEQYDTCYEVLFKIMDDLNHGLDSTAIISGVAGAGKSVVMMKMFHLIIAAQQDNADGLDKTNDDYDPDKEDSLKKFYKLKEKIHEYLEKTKKKMLNVAYMLPMTSIRKTIKRVFDETKDGLKGSMVKSPTKIKKENEYDLVFVDEAHRLSQYKNIGWRKQFKNRCKLLYGPNARPEDYTQLDWVMTGSRARIMVYDPNQTVKKTDITNDQMNAALKRTKWNRWMLETQMRCQGGNLYIDYIDKILNGKETVFQKVEDYKFEFYDSATKMIQDIEELDNKCGLCRNVAGYSWKWISKGCKSFDQVKKEHKEDIDLEGCKYVWNMSNKEWIVRDGAVKEIGCVHTTQGYDLNYVGVIFGREIDYDEVNKQIVIVRDLFFDKNVKQGATDDELRSYIINAYKILMSRGMRGCFVYACNERLRNYLKKFIPDHNEAYKIPTITDTNLMKAADKQAKYDASKE